MVYVMFEEDSIAECATVEEAREVAATLMASEPLRGEWWIEDGEGTEVLAVLGPTPNPRF